MAARPLRLLLCACLCLVGQAGATPSNDNQKDFVSQALANSAQQLARARIAFAQGGSQAVRDQAQGVIDQHQRLHRDLQVLARKQGLLGPATEPAAQSEGELQASPHFGHDYAVAQLASSRDAVDLFERQARDASNPDLQKFAKAWLPQLYHLREIVQQLADAQAP